MTLIDKAEAHDDDLIRRGVGVDVEDVARAIYDAMRFERKDKTPEWVKGGNSSAQVEARSTAARILAAFPPSPDAREAALTALWNGVTVEQVSREVEEFIKNASIWAGYAEAPECPTFSRGDARYWNERYARAAELVTVLLTENLKLAEGSGKLRKELKSVLDRESAAYERHDKRMDELHQRLRSEVRRAFEEGFVAGAQDGWTNNPRMGREWDASRAKRGLES